MRLDISTSEIKQFNMFIFASIVIDFVIGRREPFMIVIKIGSFRSSSRSLVGMQASIYMELYT